VGGGWRVEEEVGREYSTHIRHSLTLLPTLSSSSHPSSFPPSPLPPPPPLPPSPPPPLPTSPLGCTQQGADCKLGTFGGFEGCPELKIACLKQEAGEVECAILVLYYTIRRPGR
jgi:hypothetical protein